MAQTARGVSQKEMKRRREMRNSFTQYDFALLFMTIGIALFGVLMIYSAGYYAASLLNAPFRFVKQQLLGLLIGLVLMIIISKIDYQIF